MTLPTDLINVSWKPCTKDKFDVSANGKHSPLCDCNGTGLEPVEVENRFIKCNNCFGKEGRLINIAKCNHLQREREHQVGVPFEINKEIWLNNEFGKKCEPIYGVMKFLPIRAEGSKMWVVKVN